jgi:hypothetical protein
MFYDLTEDRRAALLDDLAQREAHLFLGQIMPEHLEQGAIMKAYSLTESDIKAVLKGMKNEK